MKEIAVKLLEARTEDFPFALDLYLSQMRPYTEMLMAWDEAKQRSSFAAQWVLDEVRMIALEGQVVGWLQIAESQADIRLQQFFISPAHQRGGIGTRVLADLMETWQAARKPVVLTVLKNNPARRLYERMGFVRTGEVGVKDTLHWRP